MEIKNILGILVVVVLIVALSGCTSTGNNSAPQKNEKVIKKYNLTTDSVKAVDVAIPNGTTKIKIEYVNLTSVGGYGGYFNFYTLNTTFRDGQSMSNYNGTVIDNKSVRMNVNTYYAGTVELNANNAKSVVIVDGLGKGIVKVIAVF